MPRIDPSQLLNTLSVLLAPDGGIRSADDVPRIVQLMQKFSKKLVSKCIYIHILRSSSPDLLEKFLSMKGWELLNMWFVEALKSQNYYLCGDLVKLFALCPMNADRLAENPTVNQAPKLIRQLSCDSRIEAEIRNLSLQVLQQWMTAARTPRSRPLPETELQEDDCPVVKKKPKLADNRPPKAVKQKRQPAATGRTKKTRAIIESSDSEESEDESEKRRSRDSRDGQTQPNREERPAEVKKSLTSPPPAAAARPRLMTASEIRQKLAESGSDETDVEDLLVTDSEEERKKAEAVKASKVATAAPSAAKRPAPAAAPVRNGQIDREKQKLDQRKERERLQREKENRREKAKPYSRSELRKELETGEKDRIKNLVQKMKEENKGRSSLLAGLGRIPKLPKKEPPPAPAAATPANSFEAALGSMDSRPAKVAPPPTKNKNRDLLESLASGTGKPASKSSLERKSAEREATVKRMKEETEVKAEASEDMSPVQEESPSPMETSSQDGDHEVRVKVEEEKVKQEEEESSSSSSSSSDEQKEEDEEIGNKYSGQERRSSQSSLSSVEEELGKKKDAEDTPAVANGPSVKAEADTKHKSSRHHHHQHKKDRTDSKPHKKSSSSSSSRRHRQHSESEKSRDKKGEPGKDSGKAASEPAKDGKATSETAKDSSKSAHKKEERRPSSDSSRAARPALSLDKVAEVKRKAGESDSPKVKKSPSIIKESNIFGDVLSSIMKDDLPRKKKRRLSESKSEEKTKEMAVKDKERSSSSSKDKHRKDEKRHKEKEETEKEEKETSPEPTENRKGSDSVRSEEDMPFEEPKSALPREVRGILIFARGTKSKKKVVWRPEESLVEVEYFELDETERANVWKLKSFEEMKKKEMMFEKMKLGQGQPAQEEEDRAWSLMPLDYEHTVEYGKDSKEKEEQRAREGRVLKALYFDNRLPTDPFEPDPLPKAAAEAPPPRAIPQIDLSSNSEDSTTDFSTEGWPAAGTGPSVAPPAAAAAIAPNLKDLLSSLKPSLLQNIIGLTSGAAIPSPTSSASPVAASSPPQSAPTTTVAGRIPPPELHGKELHSEVEATKTAGNGYNRPPPSAPPQYDHYGQYPPPPSAYPHGGRGVGGMRPPRHPVGGPRRPYHHPPYGGGPPARPCKFWMERGWCSKEDRCNFAHIN